jgi:hypothetical protein
MDTSTIAGKTMRKALHTITRAACGTLLFAGAAPAHYALKHVED